MARGRYEAAAAAVEIGFPVVLKAISPGVVHKSRMGGVRLDLKDEAEVRRGYDEIVSALKKQGLRLEGVSVQSMVEPGLELVIGMQRDEIFGPLVMFGLGGTTVEVLRDVVFRLAPLSRGDATEMVRSVRGYPLIGGNDGPPPRDEGWLVGMLMRLSRFALSHDEVMEMDLNPVLLWSHKGTVADARIVVAQGES